MPRIRRALAPVLLAAAALACACALERALACPISRQPQTLRVLYRHSARVVVASVGTSEVLATDGMMQLARTALHVEEDLKGSGGRLVHLYHWEPRRDESGGPNIIRLTASWRLRPEFKRGERFLFFLERREGGDGFEVNDEGYGVKALQPDELKVYRERIKELAAITRPEKEDKAALVEWLVRCAEEPATRWEGAYELQQSANALRWENERAARAAEEAARAEEATEEESEEEEEVEEAGDEESGEEEATDEEAAPEATPEATPSPAATPLWRQPAYRFTPLDPTLAPLLDAGQKRRLADALYTAREMGPGENTLLDVVKDFGETALPGFLIAHLRRVDEDPPYEAGQWLQALAHSLDSKELVELADGFARSQFYEAPATAGADGKPESDQERAERYRLAYENARRKKSAALKAALSRVELFMATGALASK
jgi:hypothetical protein